MKLIEDSYLDNIIENIYNPEEISELRKELKSLEVLISSRLLILADKEGEILSKYIGTKYRLTDKKDGFIRFGEVESIFVSTKAFYVCKEYLYNSKTKEFYFNESKIIDDPNQVNKNMIDTAEYNNLKRKISIEILNSLNE